MCFPSNVVFIEGNGFAQSITVLEKNDIKFRVQSVANFEFYAALAVYTLWIFVV